MPLCLCPCCGESYVIPLATCEWLLEKYHRTGWRGTLAPVLCFACGMSIRMGDQVVLRTGCATTDGIRRIDIPVGSHATVVEVSTWDHDGSIYGVRLPGGDTVYVTRSQITACSTGNGVGVIRTLAVSAFGAEHSAGSPGAGGLSTVGDGGGAVTLGPHTPDIRLAAGSLRLMAERRRKAAAFQAGRVAFLTWFGVVVWTSGQTSPPVGLTWAVFGGLAVVLATRPVVRYALQVCGWPEVRP